MDHPAIKLWRDQYRLNLSRNWKAEVEKTVVDLKLWKSILAKWKREKRHPGIKGILDEYESLAAADEIAKEHNGQESVSDCDRPWLSERSEGDLSQMRSDPERIYF